MAIRKLDTGKWICECYPSGRTGKRVRRQFSTKGEAVAFERHTMEEFKSKPWLAEKDDNRRLSEIIELWHSVHGVTLADSDQTLRRLKLVCAALDDPIAANLTSGDIAEFRKKRLSGTLYLKSKKRFMRTVKASTVNIECIRLHGVFSKLRKLKYLKYPNPLEDVESFKVKQGELYFLRIEEIKNLMDACESYGKDDLTTVVRICLSTGCRWNEAAKLRSSQVIPYKITFNNTKSGKNRSVPISESLYGSLPKKQGDLFSDVYNDFKNVIAMAGIDLPKSQNTHVLRHTFASHFMMNGGNILVLRDILGHSNINMTMIYAHFSPNHLEDAISKNPFFGAGLEVKNGDELAAQCVNS
ncbi:tyrosine-type recombinase/integrase [Pantoea sp. SORGH_AS_0659]|uniref:phage integrase n=1 Tax=Pantoea sp. SORGH_AS_0659 TaxID=3062597 RepID=UPI0028639CF6|nr:tyrosine-type recombinase/integrase [Pantoea sp. SORGH_AS_0659]MDR6350700.1 integrase [Pantoea sp. SORGH_AS_0659]